MSKITIISKKSHQITETTDAHVGSLNQNSVVRLKVSKDHIALITRESNHLIVTLKSGEIIIIENFFNSKFSDNNLVLEENDESLYWVKYTYSESGILLDIEYFSLNNVDSLLYAKSTFDSPALWHYGAATGLFALSVTSIQSALKSKNTPQENNIHTETDKKEFNSDLTVILDVESKDTLPSITGSVVLTDTVQPTASLSLLNDTNNNTPNISGSTEAGSIVTVVIKDQDGHPVAEGQASIDSAGNWTFTPSEPLADGTYKVEVNVSDQVGNLTKVGGEFVVDTIVPDAVIIDSIGRTNQQYPQFSGQAEANAVVHLQIHEISGSQIESVSLTVDSNGQWHYRSQNELPEGVILLSANAQDSAGNIGSNTTIDFVIDLTPPTEPIAEINSDGSLISGNAEAGALVIVKDQENFELGRDTADIDGQYSIPLSIALNDGQHLKVIAQDVAGDSKPTILTAPLITIDTMDNVAKAWINTVYPTKTTLEKDALSYSWTFGFLGLNFGTTKGSKYISNDDGKEIVIELRAENSVLIGLNNKLNVKLFKKNKDGWEFVTESGSDKFIEILHANRSIVNFKFEAQGAGEYRIDIFSSSTAGAGGSVTVDFTTTIIDKTLDKEFKSIGIAQGNVITDLDPIYGIDQITQDAYINEVNGIQIDQETLIEGVFGDLVISSNGDYIYTPKDNLDVIGLTDTFSYVVIDPMTGKSDTAKLIIQIDTADITPDSLKIEEPLQWSLTNPEAYANDDVALAEDLIGDHSTYANDDFSFEHVSNVIYRVLNENSHSGGNGIDNLEGFQLNSHHKIDISKLLSSNFDRENIGEFVFVKPEGQDVVLSIDRDGELSRFKPVDLFIIKGTQLSLEDLINSNQLIL